MPRLSSPHPRLKIAALTLAMLMSASTGLAQSDPVPAADDAPSGGPELKATPAQALREGSLLVDVQGRLYRDETHHTWVYRIEERAAGEPAYDLTLVPNSILAEMIQLHLFADGQEVVFETSGLVLVYHGQTYLLPTHAPQIVRQARPEATASTAPTADDGASAPEDDSAEAILRDLEARVGALPRSATPVSKDDSVAAPRPEGSMIVLRRGRLVRGERGAWLFVFDADATGLADPPMFIQPCLLLERMERHAMARGGGAPLIISGSVSVFESRNYLRPTVFQIPRERTQLNP